MPNTLPIPWTWNDVPEWERSVLDGLKNDLDAISGLATELCAPNMTITKKSWWYGLRVLTKTGWFKLGRSWVCDVFCCGSKVYVNSVTIGALSNGLIQTGNRLTAHFDLYDPDSLKKVFDLIGGLISDVD